MSTNSDAINPVAILMLPEGNKDLITFARAVHSSMLANPLFVNATPSLDAFKADIDAFDEAETKASLRTKGAATLRNAKKRKVKEDLFHLCDFVQSLVEATVNPTEGAAVIESANMSVKKAPKRAANPELSAKNTDILGKVALAAKPVARAATYYWEYSQDTSTWTALPETMQTRIELPGLTSARTYYFRFRALTKEGQRDCSPVVSLYVY